MKRRLSILETLREADFGQCLCYPNNDCCHSEDRLRTPCADENCHHFVWWDINITRYVDELSKEDHVMLNLLKLLYL